MATTASIEPRQKLEAKSFAEISHVGGRGPSILGSFLELSGHEPVPTQDTSITSSSFTQYATPALLQDFNSQLSKPHIQGFAFLVKIRALSAHDPSGSGNDSEDT